MDAKPSRMSYAKQVGSKTRPASHRLTQIFTVQILSSSLVTCLPRRSLDEGGQKIAAQQTPAIISPQRSRRKNGLQSGSQEWSASGTSDIEGKAARVAASERGQRVSFKIGN